MQSIKKVVLQQAAKLSSSATRNAGFGGCLWLYTYEPKMPGSLMKKRMEALDEKKPKGDCKS